MTSSQAYDLARAGFITIPDERLWEASGLPPGRDQQPVETATAEPEAEKAVIGQSRRRKKGVA
jgi:hypothetical protein